MNKTLPILAIGILFLGQIVVAFQVNDLKTEELTQSFSFDDISWTKHNIQNNFNCASIYSSDLDEDGDKDILATSAILNEIAWWQNNGRDPIVWTKHTIDDNFKGAAYCSPIDMDNDMDDDVLGAAWYDNEIAWWRNDGGDPIVWTKQIIKTSYTNAHEVFAYDMDDDGDYDVFGASAGLNEITWWRNDGGTPINWVEQKIGDCFGARSVYVADVDNDEDNDVLGADFTTNKIIMWKNNGGNPIQWTGSIIDNNFAGAHHVHAHDIDKDGDSDVLGAAYINDDISWWRNDGGNPITWTEQIIDGMFNGALRVDVADIDKDGDFDILGSADLSNCISWWRNDGGNPITWTKKIIDAMCTGAWPLHVSDIDDDGDVDVIGGGKTGISWYENSLYTKCDLECEGSLIWIKVKPSATVSKTFKVKNNGNPGSFLNWNVASSPTFGTWSYSPSSGIGLAAGSYITVTATCIAPASSDNFAGKVKVENSDNPTDYCEVDVDLTTPRSGLLINTFLMRFLERFPNAFPLLRQILLVK